MRACTGADVAALFDTLADWFAGYTDHLNALNVYPVPDGDTGTNMAGTLRAGARGVAASSSGTFTQALEAAARGALMGASGNSGVILSQMLRGLSEACRSATNLDGSALQEALAGAADAGYRAVSHPVEGTMLTVARRAAEGAGEVDSADPVRVLEAAVRAAALAVEETPLQLDRLREAGVVDAGGEGVRLLLEGWWRWMANQPLEPPTRVAAASRSLVASQELQAEVGFCTQFLIEQPSMAPSALRDRLEQVGTSVILVEGPGLVRVHLHAERPGQALDLAADVGCLAAISIENMELQHRHAAASAGQAVSDIGVMAAAQTDSMAELLRSLGAAATIRPASGASPSVEEFLRGVQGLGYEHVIVLPNDPNAALAAEQVGSLTPRSLRIVSTRNIADTVRALMAFNFEADLGSNVARMQAAADETPSFELARASRAARIGDAAVAPGDIVLFERGKPALAEADLVGAARRGLGRLEADGHELATVYRGPKMEQDEADALLAAIAQCAPSLDVEVVDAGPPHRLCVIALE